MAINGKIKQLYDAIKSDGGDVGTEEEFNDWFLRPGEEGYNNRKRVYDTFKSDGADVGANYEEFRDWLGLRPADAGAAASTAAPSAPTQQPSASVEAEVDEDWQPTSSQKAVMSNIVQSSLAGFNRRQDEAMERLGNTADYYNRGGGVLNGRKPIAGDVRYNPYKGEVEQTYIAPNGTVTADKREAERETRAYNDYVDNTTIAGQLRRAGRDLTELHRKREMRVKAIHEKWKESQEKNNAPLAVLLGSNTYSPTIESDPEYRALTAAIHSAEERVRTLQHESDRQGGKDVGFWRGFGEVVSDLKTWDFGYSDFMDAMTRLDADDDTNPHRIAKSDDVKRSEQIMMEQTREADDAAAEYGDNESFFYRAGVMLAEMLPFMLDFAVMVGSSSGISLLTRNIGAVLLKGLHKAAPKVARKKAVQWTTKVVGAMPEDLLYRAPLMTNSVQSMKTSADIIDRKLGNVVEGDDGNYVFSNDKTWGSAVWQGEANAIIENYSEMFGTHLEGVLSLGTMAKVADIFGAKRMSDLLTKASSGELSGIAATVKKRFSQLGVSDYVGEVGEEYYGQLWRTMLNVDDAYKHNPDGSRTNLFLDGQFHGDIWGGMALSMGLMGLGRHSITAASYVEMKYRVNRADKRASGVFDADAWEGLRERIDGTTNNDIGELADKVIFDDSLSDEQKDAAMGYMEASMNLRGFNLASIARQRGMEMSAEEALANEGYIDGYSATTPQEMVDARLEMERQRMKLVSSMSEDVADEFDADPLDALARTYDPEIREIASKYVNARMVYDGMIQRVRDDIDGRIAQSDAMIDGRVNRDTGMIQGATLTDGKEVYVVNGSVAMLDDGINVDIENSDESLIVRDAEGRLEFVAPSQVQSLLAPVDAASEKEAAAEAIRNEIAQSAADKIDGVLHFAPNDVYAVINEDGSSESLTIVGESVDASGVAVDGMVDVMREDGSVVAMNTADIQRMVDESNARRLEERDKARESAEADKGVEADGGGLQGDAAADAERSTALSRIPVDESGEPLYEQVDADTAWDAFVEQSEGDEEIAREVVADIVAEKRKELADAEKALKSIGESKPNASNGEGALTVQERIVAKMALKRALTDARDAVERAKGVVDHWQSIGDTVKRRAEAEAAERRRQAEIAAEEARQAAERERIEADGGGGTLLSFAERGRQGDIQNTQRRQQDYIPQTEEITANLSEEETDEYGKPLVLAKDGTTVFGFIDFESGLTEAPIRLSLGENSKDKKGVNHGYGLMHIEAGHGDQIRNAGYETVEEFVEDVAKNYTEITEGAKIGDNQTYLLEVPDKHNNTLFVQLSKDGTYWNVNSAGIFKKKYSRRKPKVYSVPALRDGKDTDTTEVNSGQSNGATAPAGNSSQTSKAEVNENFIEKQADSEEKRDGRKELAAVTMWKKKNFTHTDANHEVTPIPDLSEVSDGKGNALSTHNQIIVDESPYKQEDNAESLNHGLDDLDDSALAERIVVSDDDWTEGDGETPTYKRTINIDGKHTVVQVDEPDGNGFYTGSYFDYQGTRFGGIAEVIEHIDKHVKLASDIAAAEAEVNTSPTDKQKEAGNYKKGHVRVGAFDVTIENPKGSVRRGTDATGKKWEQTMSHTYGYIKGTEGVDGDHIDVFLSSDIDGWDGRRVYVVDQYNPDGTFDEHKVMLGFNSENDAYNAYLSNYESGWEKGRRLDVGAVDIREFEKWVDSSHRKTKAFSEYRSVKSDRRGMDEREISSLLNKMKSQAVTIPYVEITEESWKQYFETPIGNVKMGENQKEKLFNKDRTNQYGMLAETLSNPDIILEESDQQENIFHERPSSYLFIKTFKKRDGSKYVHFENVTVSQGGLEVSISSHIIRENQLKNKMKSDRLLYKATALDESVNSSAEQPINKGDSLSSTGKDNALSSEKQANNKKSSDWNGVETEGTFLGEKEYIERMVENAFNNRKDKSQAREEWEDEDEYISTYNRIADSYVDYISGLKERGELQRMYDAASLGDRIKIRNGVATAGFEVHEMIDFEKERQQARRKRKERKAEHTKAIMSKIGISTDTTEVAEPGQNTAGATDSDAKFSVGSEVKGDADAYNATKGLVESTGIEVVEVSGEEAQAMMEQKNTPFAGLPNRANEKQSSGSVFLSINGNSSSNRADSKEYEAKLQNKTLSAKTKIAKFKNGDYLVNTGSLSDTIKDLGKLLAMDTKGGSRYTILRTDKGDTVAIRLSDHRANGNNFGRDAAERNLSIVIERKRYDVPDSGIEFTEVVIPQSVFESRPEEVVSAIVNGVEAVLADKPFTLDSSIGTVEEIGQNVGHAHLLHTPSGVVYGWTVGGKVYLNRDAMNPEAPIHEYTHLWDEMVRRENPHLWERGKDLMKQMPLWNEIVADSNYADIRDDEDAVASEVHARLTGRAGARLLSGMIDTAKGKGAMATAEAVSVVDSLKRWLTEMLDALKATLGKWSKRNLDELTIEDFNNLTLRDIAEGVNPQEGELSDARFHAAMSRGREDFDAVRERAIAERGIVTPGLNRKEIRVVDVPRHDFTGTGKQALKAAEKWAKENITGNHTATDSRGDKFEYSISGDAVEKYVSRSATIKSGNIGAHLAALKKLPRIISESVEAEIHADYKKHNGQRSAKSEVNTESLVHRFYGAANINGVTYRVKTTIRQYRDMNRTPLAHSYEITQIELLEMPSDGVVNNSGELLTMISNSSISAANLLQGVEKSYDPGKKLLEESRLSDVSEAEDVRYRIREDEPPTKTGIGYKVFVLKEGKLYPPMVANPNGEATPVGVWLDADAAPIAGLSKTGRQQVKAGGKGTQGGSGKLAYRPGWHLGVIPYALQFNRKDESTGERELFPKNFVWAEVEYADDVDYQEEAMSYGYNSNGKFQHSYAGLPRLPLNGSYKYRTNPNPETDPWIITGAMKVNRLLTPTEVDSMVEAAGREPQRRQEGAVTDADIERLNDELTAERERSGDGSYSDAEVSMENDPWSKAWGETLRSKREQRAFAKRERERMRAKAVELSERLGVDIEIIEDNSSLEGKRGRSKGWYSVKDGRISVVIGNHVSVADIEKTVLHEAVAHHGLRELLGEHFDEFLDKVYDWADNSIKERIALLASRNGWNRRVATEEYLAGLAEDTDFENAKAYNGWWGKIRRLFLDMLSAVGFKRTGVELSDNELRYILWRSYKNMVEPGRFRAFEWEAEDVAMKYNLKAGEYAESSPVTEQRVAEAGELYELNDRFNNELNRQIAGDLPQGHVYDMGMPSEYLLSTGIARLPIRLSAKILNVKSNLERHAYNLETLRNLVYAIQKPWAIFSYGDRSKAQNMIIGIEDNGRQFLVGISINPTLKGRVLEINSIRNVFPKNNHEWVNWINEGKLLRVDGKKEIQDIIAKLRMNPVAFDYVDLDNAAKIVENFKNPTIREQNNNAGESSDDGVRYRMGDFTPRDRKIAADVYDKMVSSARFEFSEAMQDSMLGLKKLYEAIKGKKGFRIEEVEGYENAYTYENRMSSTNGNEQHLYFIRKMKPLLKAISDICGNSDSERRILTDYMIAKHGLERNVILAERDAREAASKGADYNDELAKCRQRDYSGLTALTGEKDLATAERVAQQMVDDYERDTDTTELWSRVKSATEATLEKMYTSGLMSEDRFNQVRGMFQHYIPLRGWDETTSNEVYTYLLQDDHATGTSLTKKSGGRSSKADDPIANIAAMADSAISQGNRNIMKQRFLNFVLNNPSDLVSHNELWLEHDAVNDEWRPVFAELDAADTPADVAKKIEAFEARMESLQAQHPDKYKRGSEAVNIPYKVVGNNLREHQVLVRRNGVTTVLTINGNPRAAQALNGLTNPDVKAGSHYDEALSVVMYVNRQLSALYTTRNPDFVVSNFMRDMLYSNCMTWVKETPSYALRYHRNFGKFNPAVMAKLLNKYENGTLNSNDYIEHAFEQFMANGGETGFTNLKDIEGHKRAIAKELRRQGNVALRGWSALGMKLDLMNRSVENCARFAAYVTSREMGRSVDRSIYDAKEISVNFNKKGSGGTMAQKNRTLLGKIGAHTSGWGRLLYVFWNAGIQGMTNYGRAAKRNPAKATAAATALFSLGWVIPLLAQAGGGDDDDKNAYYNLPSYIRRSNICFRAGEQWVTIPLPIEYRAIYGLGELAYGAISGNERYSDDELCLEVMAQFSQLLPIDMLEGGGGLSPFIPSAAKPAVEAYVMNKSWTGLPIYKDTGYNKDDPEWTKAYKNADQHLVKASRWLNEVSGGDDFKKGSWWGDVNPAKLEYLLNGMFGGMVSFPSKVVKTVETIGGSREFEWRNIPFANRVIRSGDERTANRRLKSDYYKYKKEAMDAKRLARKYESRGQEGFMEYAEKADFLYNSPEYRRALVFTDYEPDIKALEQSIDDAGDPNVRKMLETDLYSTMREMVNELDGIAQE